MKEKLIGFLQSPNGSKSLRRLAGVESLQIILLLASIGGGYFLLEGKHDYFIQVLEILAWLCGSLLSVTTIDYFAKKK